MKNKIKSVFKINKNLIPMYFVGIAKNQHYVKKIFNWGWRNEIEIVSWPSFYTGKNLKKNLLKRWSKYICIPLNQVFFSKNKKINFDLE